MIQWGMSRVPDKNNIYISKIEDFKDRHENDFITTCVILEKANPSGLACNNDDYCNPILTT
jgi:hypothetical protein